MPASITTMSAYQFPELIDISKTGAKLKGLRLPPKGATALLKTGPLEVLCKVMWVEGELCGIRFDEAVSPVILGRVERQGAVELQSPYEPATV
ncbi:hypothetical protein H9L15_08695 [Sphingomonas daechungensis]|uniref:PilZ domain-containing protein n=2 Tax=Sphingomonas daechungensis TaxID=1176646 RepID=A0ABX6SXS4_9SPHN|nr:PilZ domain-containing protein [Sphingomonas daechungensis]QNP42394.1 hypothetical protein H9L15_08695 [Sphingomonas daechungensis]